MCVADVWERRSCSWYLASVGFLQQIINAVWRRAQEFHLMHTRRPLRGYSSRHPCLGEQPWFWRLLHWHTLARGNKEKNSPKLVKGPKHLISFEITSPLTVFVKLFVNHPHIFFSSKQPHKMTKTLYCVLWNGWQKVDWNNTIGMYVFESLWHYTTLVPEAFFYSLLANFATRIASIFLLARSASISASCRKFPCEKR